MAESGVSTRGQADKQAMQDLSARMEELFGRLCVKIDTQSAEMDNKMAERLTSFNEEMNNKITERFTVLSSELNNTIKNHNETINVKLAEQSSYINNQLSETNAIVRSNLLEYREACEQASQQLEARLVEKMKETETSLEKRFEAIQQFSSNNLEKIGTLQESLVDTRQHVTILEERVMVIYNDQTKLMEQHQAEMNTTVETLSQSLSAQESSLASLNKLVETQQEEVSDLKSSMDLRIVSAAKEVRTTVVQDVERENLKLKKQVEQLIATRMNGEQMSFGFERSHACLDDKVKRFRGTIFENPIEHPLFLNTLVGDHYWPEREKLRIAEVSLDGAALLWWKTTHQDVSDFQEFETNFRSEFWSVKKQSETRTRLYADKYQDGGYRTLEEHFVLNWERSRHLQPNMEDAEFACMFISQLPVRLQDLLLHSHRGTIKELREDLRKLDQIEWTRRVEADLGSRTASTKDTKKENWREEAVPPSESNQPPLSASKPGHFYKNQQNNNKNKKQQINQQGQGSQVGDHQVSTNSNQILN